MALTLSIRDNRTGHCSFSTLDRTGQRAGVGGSCGEAAQGGQRARDQTHGKHGGRMAEARSCPPKLARSGLEAALPGYGVRTTGSTVRNAILNARPESDITLERLECRASGRPQTGEPRCRACCSSFNCTHQSFGEFGYGPVIVGEALDHILYPQSPRWAPTQWCKSSQQRCCLQAAANYPPCNDKGTLFYSVPATSSVFGVWVSLSPAIFNRYINHFFFNLSYVR
jgi:hypothetical protein